MDPDRWVDVLDGQRYVRKVRTNGTVVVDNRYYYVGHAWAGKYVNLRLDAAQRAFVVEYREQPIKVLPVKGLQGAPVSWEDYVIHIMQEARAQVLAGPTLGRQLRFPI